MAPKKGKTQKAKQPQLVDLNTATKSDIVASLGVSSALADRIIAARPFTSLADLKARVSRLREAVLKKFKPLVTFSGVAKAKAAAKERAAAAKRQQKKAKTTEDEVEEKQELVQQTEEEKEQERKEEEEKRLRSIRDYYNSKRVEKGTSAITFTIDPVDVFPTAVLSIILKMVDVPTRVVNVRAVSHKWRAALLQRSTWHDVDLDLSKLVAPLPHDSYGSYNLTTGRWSCEESESEADRKKRFIGVHVFMNLLRTYPDMCTPASIEISGPETVWGNERSFAAALQAMNQVPKLEVDGVRQREASVLREKLPAFCNLRDLNLRFRSNRSDAKKPVFMTIPSMCSLRTLAVHDGHITINAGSLPSLTSLHLDDIIGMAGKPFSLPPSLTDLTLNHLPSYSYFHTAVSDDPTLVDSRKMIGRAVSALPSLKHLSTNILPQIMCASSSPAFAESLQSLRITEAMDSECAKGMILLKSVESLVFSCLPEYAGAMPHDALSTIGQMPRLQSLQIHNCAVKDAHFPAMDPASSSLRHLLIEGPDMIVEGGYQPQYEYRPDITNRCLEPISQFPALESLTLTNLGGMVNDFSPLQHCSSLRTLAFLHDARPVYTTLSSLQQLTTLEISNREWDQRCVRMTDADFRAVCTLTNLRSLKLHHYYNSDLSLGSLSAVSAMSKLETLWVTVCSLPEITPHLLALPNNNLRSLTYRTSLVSMRWGLYQCEEAEQSNDEKRCEVRLKKRFPDIEITQLQPEETCHLC